MPPGRLLPLPGFGASTTDQVPPVSCRTSTSLLSVTGSTKVPTAQTDPPDWARPYRLVQSEPADAGSFAMVHLPPERCSISGRPPCAGLFASPATHTSVGVAVTASSSTDGDVDSGNATTDQRLPFQCSTRPWSGAAEPSRWPTAQTSCGVTASTAYRWLPVRPGFGVAKTCHVCPFQCSASVSKTPFAPSRSPTTQTLDRDSADAPKNMSRIAPGCGTLSMRHLVPFHVSTSARSWYAP